MTITKDQVAAVMRHVYTAIGAGVAVAVALGAIGQEDADKTVDMVRQLGEGLGIVVGALAALLPIISALRAGKSASPEEQIRKVHQNPTNGVEVVSVTEEGEKTLEKIKGEAK
jgi:hypothetical protein